MNCPCCNAPNLAFAKKCHSCGEDLPQTRQPSFKPQQPSSAQRRRHRRGNNPIPDIPLTHCPWCNEGTKPGASKCPHCGSRILTLQEATKRNSTAKILLYTSMAFLLAVLFFSAVLTIKRERASWRDIELQEKYVAGADNFAIDRERRLNAVDMDNDESAIKQLDYALYALLVLLFGCSFFVHKTNSDKKKIIKAIQREKATERK